MRYDHATGAWMVLLVLHIAMDALEAGPPGAPGTGAIGVRDSGVGSRVQD
jgi:hypothetical protein